MSSVFLSARWEHLILLTYTVQDDVLQPYLPKGLELDRFHGQACVSFVAFRFLRTKVWGVRWPLHVNFNEVNLRFYVRDRAGRRGVVFVKEYVPSFITSTIARLAYNEPYSRATIGCTLEPLGSEMRVEYQLRRRGTHRVEIEAARRAETPGADSPEHFFKEHEWGYGRTRTGNTRRYRVEHPVWRCFPVRRYGVSVDFAALYGDAWSFLTEQQPVSVVLAEGSDVTVSRPESLATRVVERDEDEDERELRASSGTR